MKGTTASILLHPLLLLAFQKRSVAVAFVSRAAVFGFAASRHRQSSCFITTLSRDERQYNAGGYSSASALWLSSDAAAASSSSSKQQQQHLRRQRQQRVAVVGAGAVGSYYGARLWQVGHDVHFYLRGENYAAAKAHGLTVTSVEGDVRIPSDVLKAYETTESMATATAAAASQQQQQQQTFDWVLVALKSSALDAIPDLIHPLLSQTTRVLVIMNGMIEEDLMRMMREKTHDDHDQKLRVLDNNKDSSSNNNDIDAHPPPPLQCCRAWYGGMALICCNRIAPAVVDHSYFGLLSAGVASTLSRGSSDEDRIAFEELFADTVVDVAYEDSLLRGRWKKMLWNLPFNGISVAMGGITVDKIVTDPGLRQLAYTIMDETIAAANAELEHVHGAGNFVPLGEKERAAMMKLSDDMGPYKPSTMLDFVNRRSMEVQYLFRTPVTRAERLGVPVPHLETVVTQIEAFQRLHNLF